MEHDKAFTEVLNAVPENIRRILVKISASRTEKIQEICLRTNLPVLLRGGDGFKYLTEDGELTCIYRNSAYILNKQDINETFLKVCEYSVHSKYDRIRKGYITIKGGHRVGVCGTAVTENGKITTINDISSLNVRISREYPGCASNLIREFFASKKTAESLLIAGPPLAGKTTLLRDLCRQLSRDITGGYRVALVDEREEISGTVNGAAGYDLGVNVDVLNGYPKAEAIQTAVRCFAPDLILCDEISTVEEAVAVLEGTHSGVKFVLTVHAFDKYDLIKRPCITAMLCADVFKNVIILTGRDENKFAEYERYEGKDLINEAGGDFIYDNVVGIRRQVGRLAM